jgi:NAD kinase
VIPVCPHTFFNRALILNDDTTVVLKNTSERALTLLMDGRALAELSSGSSIRVRRSNKTLKMISLSSNRVLSTLFTKLQKLQSVQE